ncbi:hypothetical protein NECID01_1662 [Nematocida sp. AWRm77]|nr:hypothetical protein NECID01_1662 [Nematocida sp. AWRm77]
MILKVPAQVRITEQAASVLGGDSVLQESVEEACREMLAEKEYVRGALQESTRTLLGRVVQGMSVGEIGAVLRAEVGAYRAEELSPVEILFTTEEDGGRGSIQIRGGMGRDEVRESVIACVGEEVQRRTQAYFSVSGIWALGKHALLGQSSNLAEKAFYMAVQGSYERALSVVSLVPPLERSGLLSEIGVMCKHHTGRSVEEEYVVKESASLADALRYVLALHAYVESASAEERPRLEYTVGFLLGRVECREEESLRVLLNLLCCGILERLGVEPAKQVVLLVDSGDIMERVCGEESAEYFRFIIALYSRAKKVCTMPDVSTEICAKIVRMGSVLGEYREEVQELARHPSWVQYHSLVKQHLKDLLPTPGRPEIEAALEIQVRFVKVDSGKGRRKWKGGSRSGSGDGSGKWKGDGDGDGDGGKEGKWKYAEMRYTRKSIEENEAVFAGQKVRVQVQVKTGVGVGVEVPGSMEIDGAEIEGEYVGEDKEIHRLVLSMGPSMRKSFVVPSTDRIVFGRAAVSSDGLILHTCISSTLRVDPRPYVRPRVKYRSTVGAFGLTEILAEGCLGKPKGVFLPPFGKKALGLKKAVLEKFYVQDCAENTLRVCTPHKHTEEKKPVVCIKSTSKGHCVSIEGSIKQVFVSGPWKIKHSPSPNTHPSSHPSTHPSSTHPDIHPSSHPDIHPSSHPSSHPSTHPDIHPSTHPDTTPTSTPTSTCSFRLQRVGRFRVTSEKEDDPLPSPQGSSLALPSSSEIEKAVTQILLFEDVPYRHTPEEMAVQKKFFCKDQVVKELSRLRRKNILAYMPVRAGTDPVLIVHTGSNVFLTAIRTERALSQAPYSLWSPWSQVLGISNTYIFPSQILQLKKIHGLLTESHKHTGKNAWYSEGLLVRAHEHAEGSSIYITNYSAYAHFIIMIGMKITHAAPHERIAYVSSTSTCSLCPSITRME